MYITHTKIDMEKTIESIIKDIKQKRIFVRIYYTEAMVDFYIIRNEDVCDNEKRLCELHYCDNNKLHEFLAEHNIHTIYDLYDDISIFGMTNESMFIRSIFDEEFKKKFPNICNNYIDKYYTINDLPIDNNKFLKWYKKWSEKNEVYHTGKYFTYEGNDIPFNINELGKTYELHSAAKATLIKALKKHNKYISIQFDYYTPENYIISLPIKYAC